MKLREKKDRSRDSSYSAPSRVDPEGGKQPVWLSITDWFWFECELQQESSFRFFFAYLTACLPVCHSHQARIKKIGAEKDGGKGATLFLRTQSVFLYGLIGAKIVGTHF